MVWLEILGLVVSLTGAIIYIAWKVDQRRGRMMQRVNGYIRPPYRNMGTVKKTKSLEVALVACAPRKTDILRASSEGSRWCR